MEKVVKRFSIRKKLIIIFGTLVAVASLVQGLLSIKTARKAVIEKVQIHLTDILPALLMRKLPPYSGLLKELHVCPIYMIPHDRMKKR